MSQTIDRPPTIPQESLDSPTMRAATRAIAEVLSPLLAGNDVPIAIHIIMQLNAAGIRLVLTRPAAAAWLRQDGNAL